MPSPSGGTDPREMTREASILAPAGSQSAASESMEVPPRPFGDAETVRLEPPWVTTTVMRWFPGAVIGAVMTAVEEDCAASDPRETVPRSLPKS